MSRFLSHLQHSRPCCIGYTNSRLLLEFVYPIQHGHSCCNSTKTSHGYKQTEVSQELSFKTSYYSVLRAFSFKKIKILTRENKDFATLIVGLIIARMLFIYHEVLITLHCRNIITPNKRQPFKMSFSEHWVTHCVNIFTISKPTRMSVLSAIIYLPLLSKSTCS
jgi:hypothetical protein